MQEVKLVIFEDNPQILDVLKRGFTSDQTDDENSFSIVGTASTMEEARSLVEEMDDGVFDVAIVDGNLTPGKYDGNDGKEIVSLLRKTHLGAKVIAYSAGDTCIGADEQIPKSSGFFSLFDAVNKR